MCIGLRFTKVNLLSTRCVDYYEALVMVNPKKFSVPEEGFLSDLETFGQTNTNIKKSGHCLHLNKYLSTYILLF